MSRRPPVSPVPHSDRSVDEISNVSSVTGSTGGGSDRVQRTPGKAKGARAPAALDSARRESVASGGEMSATKVFVRVRPFNQKELTASSGGAAGGELRAVVRIEDSKPSFITTLDPAKNYAGKNTYVFERCFNSVGTKLASATSGAAVNALEESNVGKVTDADIKHAEQDQLDVYSFVGKPVLDNAIHGYNGCVFAYGQTGSGKTFSMMGPPSLFATGANFSNENPDSTGAFGAFAEAVGTRRGSIGGARKFSRANTATAGVTAGPASNAGMDDAASRMLTDAVKRLGQSTEGIIPRLSRELFQELNRGRTQDSARSFRVELEYYEIYNEKVMDLLHTGAGSGTELRVRNAAAGPYVEGLERKHVESAEEVLRCLRKGNSERHTASTKMNDRSSRSHAILVLYVTQMRLTTVSEDSGSEASGRAAAAEKTDGTVRETSRSRNDGGNEIVERRRSKINLVDLAGSERTGASEVTGKHFKEATNINLSLTTLGRVIDALADLSQFHSQHGGAGDGGRSPGKRTARPRGDSAAGAESGPAMAVSASTTVGSGYSIFVPYRDSNLTWLLRDSLGGNSKTTMIATVSPHCSNFEETCQTLRYASRAKQIMTKAIVNEDPQQRLIKQLTAEVERLKKLLSEGKADTADDDDDYVEELRQRVCELESELVDARADLERAETEVIGLRNILQDSTTTSKTEVKAVAKEGEMKVTKLRQDVQKLEEENMNMAILEGDLKKAEEKANAVERRMTVALRQAEKESKAQQTTIKKLERENRDLEQEREKLRTVRDDLKAAEERENELAARLQQVEQQNGELRSAQMRVISSGDDGTTSGGDMQLSEDSMRQLQAFGLMPVSSSRAAAKKKPTAPALIESLVGFSTSQGEELGRARQQCAALEAERDRLLQQQDCTTPSKGRAAGAGGGGGSSTAASPRGAGAGGKDASPRSGGAHDEKKSTAKQLRQAEHQLAVLQKELEAQRADTHAQLLEKTEASRRSQMEVKRLKEELKAEHEQAVATEKRMANEHLDAMRRLEEDVRGNKLAVKETKKAHKDLSANLAAAHEKEVSDLATERDQLRASLDKLKVDHKTLQKKCSEMDVTLTDSLGAIEEFQAQQVEEYLAGKGSQSADRREAVIASFPRYEAVSRSALVREAQQSLQLLYTQQDVLLTMTAERAELRQELADKLSAHEQLATVEREGVQDALNTEKAAHARTSQVLARLAAAMVEQQEKLQSNTRAAAYLPHTTSAWREAAQDTATAEEAEEDGQDAMSPHWAALPSLCVANAEDLQSTVSRLAEMEDALEEAKRSSVEQVQALQDTQEKEKQDLAARVSEHSAACRQLEEEKLGLQTRLQEMEATQKELQQSVSAMTADQLAQAETLKELEQSLLDARQEHAEALNSAQAQHASALGEERQNAASLTERCETLTDQLAAAEEAREHLQREYASKAAEAATADAAAAASHAAHMEQETVVASLSKALFEEKVTHTITAEGATRVLVARTEAQDRLRLHGQFHAALQSIASRETDALVGETQSAKSALEEEKSALESQLAQLQDTHEQLAKRLEATQQSLQDTKAAATATAGELEERYETLREQLATAQAAHEARVDSLNTEKADELAALQSTMEAAEGTAQQQAAELQARVAALAKQVEKAETSHAESEAARVQLAEELDELRATAASQQSDANERIASLEATVQRSDEQRRQQVERAVALQAEHDDARGALQTELQTAQKEAAVSAAAAEASASRVAELEALLAEKDAEQQEVTVAHASLAASLAAAQEATAAEKSAKAAVQESLNSARADLARETAQKEDAAASVDSLTRKADALAEEKAALERALARAEQALLDAQEEGAAAVAAAASERSDAEAAHVRAGEALERELRNAEATVREKSAALEKLEVQLAAREQHLQDVKTQSEQNLAQAKSKEKKLQTTLDSLQSSHNSALSENAKLQTSLQQLEKSTAQQRAAHQSALDKAHATIAANSSSAAEQQERYIQLQAEVQELRKTVSKKDKALASREAGHADSVAAHEATIASLNAELEETKQAHAAVSAQLQELTEQHQQHSKSLTTATERKNQEIARLKEDLEFRANLDLCEADQRSFAGAGGADDVGSAVKGAGGGSYVNGSFAKGTNASFGNAAGQGGSVRRARGTLGGIISFFTKAAGVAGATTAEADAAPGDASAAAAAASSVRRPATVYRGPRPRAAGPPYAIDDDGNDEAEHIAPSTGRILVKGDSHGELADLLFPASPLPAGAEGGVTSTSLGANLSARAAPSTPVLKATSFQAPVMSMHDVLSMPSTTAPEQPSTPAADDAAVTEQEE